MCVSQLARGEVTVQTVHAAFPLDMTHNASGVGWSRTVYFVNGFLIIVNSDCDCGFFVSIATVHSTSTSKAKPESLWTVSAHHPTLFISKLFVIIFLAQESVYN